MEPQASTAILQRRLSLRSMPVFTLYVLVALIPMEGLWLVASGSDSILKPYRVAGVFFFASTLLYVAQTGRLRFETRDLLFFGSIGSGLFGSAIWAMVEGVTPTHTFHALPMVAFGLVTYLLMKVLSLTQREVTNCLWVFAAATYLSIPFGKFAHTGRLLGMYKNPNSLGFSLMIVLTIVMCASLFTDRKRSLISLALSGISIVGTLIACVLTYSRGSVIGTAVIAVLILFLASQTKQKLSVTYGRAFALLGIAIAIVAVGNQKLAESIEKGAGHRYTAESVQELGGRGDIFRAALNVGFQAYGLGVGLGQYQAYHRESVQDLDYLITPSISQHEVGTHNHFLDLFVNHGLIGLTLYLIFFAGLVRESWRARVLAEQSWLFASLFPVCIAMAIWNMSANCLLSPLYYVPLGLLTSGARLARRRFA